ncbi:MAG: DNA-binding protein [Dysgonamonadaceae bacterium]|jgi:predicted histone-like DNA-binding protein|nr:DNA-binding protein [Dysgonamonadaceae bacterium]
MKYRVIQRKNPQDPQAEGLFYANAVNEGKFSLRDFAKEIEGRSSLTRGDILNVLENFLDELPTFLKLGYSVQLGDFATLHLNLQSESAPTAEEFNAGLIKGVKVIFTPSVDMKTALKGIHFEQIAHTTPETNKSN